MRLSWLVLLSVAYIVEKVMKMINEPTYRRKETYFILLSYAACLAAFLIEFVYIAKQTPTADVLAQYEEVIDYKILVDNFQMLYYLQAINLIILIAYLIPFFQFLVDIQSTLNVITEIGSLIMLFGVLWWGFAIMFAYVITNTWGYQLKGFRNLQSAVLQMLATMVFASNEERLDFENKETGEQYKFLFILSMTIYVLKLLIVCQVTAIIIEQYRKVMLNWNTIE